MVIKGTPTCSNAKKNCGNCTTTKTIEVHAANGGKQCGPTTVETYVQCPGKAKILVLLEIGELFSTVI